jgi:hypothetical protein
MGDLRGQARLDWLYGWGKAKGHKRNGNHLP